MTQQNSHNFLFEPYTKLPRVPEKLLPRFRKLCGLRYIDILLHMPTGVIHRTYRPRLADCLSEEISVLID